MDRDAIIAALIFSGSGSGGGGADAPLVVTFSKSGSTWSCDTSGDDIKAAVAAGKSVYGIYNNLTVFQLTLCAKNSNAIEFSTVSYYDQPGKTVVWTLFGRKMVSVWVWTSTEIPLPPAITNSDTDKVLSVTSVSDGTVEWATDRGSPFPVNFTITGQPVDGVYPLSADKTLAEIDAAIKAGADVIGTCNIGHQDTPQARISSTKYTSGDLSFVGFTILGLVSGSPVMGMVEYDTNGASLTMIPLSTAQMSYDSGTGTLAITE